MTKSASPDNKKPEKPKKRQSRRAKSTRINLIISDNLLKMIDQAAKKGFTTRSDILRTAVVWYLWPQGRNFDKSNKNNLLDEIIRPLNQRKMKAELNKFLKENKDEIDAYDS